MTIDVLTICRNPGNSILRTALSIAEQTHPCRWVVIDGASKDGTTDLLRQLNRPPDLLISEPDTGIADAFNKALAQATGDAVLFLNAGDAFTDAQALQALSDAWDTTRHRWITGGAEVRREDESLLFSRCPPGNDARSLVQRGCRIWHAATLCQTSLLHEVGGFDTSFRSSMDYELWLRLFARDHQPQIYPHNVARFYVGGTSAHLGRRLAEDRRARALHGQLGRWPLEWRLSIEARIKSLIPRWKWTYQIKERLGI